VTAGHELADAEVAETSYAREGWKHQPLRLIIRRVAHQADALSDDPRARRKRTIPREQLALGLAGEAGTVYGYSFILSDRAGTPAGRVTTASARRSRNASKTRNSASACAACSCQISTATASGCTALHRARAEPARAAQRSHVRARAPGEAKPSGCAGCCSASPTRVIHHARQIILHLPAGLPSAPAFAHAYNAARGFARPALA
jgi:hypothetical protein